ncbi:MAG: hypothetical protein JWN40_124 [Phycisphaerales bacterium]|nr:hypothetical protein [Phycisphaerales bacterium]
MAIRLVNESGNVFWFTSGDWLRLIEFAARHGWPLNAALDPQNWDGSLACNDAYEILGGASLTATDSLAIADAIDRALRDDQTHANIASKLETRETEVRRILPDYDPAKYATEVLKRWGKFAAFARTGALRVDLTD